ncbi:hypothetical protein [Streptomyces sp. CB02009]|uniref:hypothetical protein n=1 Tax=Streptomyces sp. CB02009 TaxID=1703938 RepID=UPI000B1D67AD|nr:hypothetical protein [Streptomyces sp. CB02009]
MSDSRLSGPVDPSDSSTPSSGATSPADDTTSAGAAAPAGAMTPAGATAPAGDHSSGPHTGSAGTTSTTAPTTGSATPATAPPVPPVPLQAAPGPVPGRQQAPRPYPGAVPGQGPRAGEGAGATGTTDAPPPSTDPKRRQRRTCKRPGTKAVATLALAGVLLGAAGCLLPWTAGPDADLVPAGAHPTVGVVGLGTTLGWAGGDARVSLLLLLLAFPAVLAWYLGWCGVRQRISGAAAGLAALLWTVTALVSDPDPATWEGAPLDVSLGPGGFLTAAGAALVVAASLTARRDPLSDFLATARRVHSLWLRGDRVEAVRRSQALLARGDRTLGDRDPDVRNLWFVHALMLAELGAAPQAVRSATVAAARWVDRDRAREHERARGRAAGTPGPRWLVALHRDGGTYTTWAVLLNTDAVPVLLGEAARVLVAEPGPMALLREALPEIQAALAAEATAHLPAQSA